MFPFDFLWLLATIVLWPSGRPVTTPSSWWFPSGSGPKAEVTSLPLSVTSTSPSGVLSGTAISIRASSPETYCAGLETTLIVSAFFLAGVS